jgi:hypothetical protein
MSILEILYILRLNWLPFVSPTLFLLLLLLLLLLFLLILSAVLHGSHGYFAFTFASRRDACGLSLSLALVNMDGLSLIDSLYDHMNFQPVSFAINGRSCKNLSSTFIMFLVDFAPANLITRRDTETVRRIPTL